ncbi:poly-gamma-glutamate synthesis protein (capsule biosynthesis protein) [Nocardiopsis sp. Huas11]|uniref:CapA family protein n=1 Tax=Nocardiopsis sp. Huas11 TaxID=2183912 RepID=UPI000EB2D828|nr:CapA family protein [Nocardiopsis sp. Huas11]RKS08215.1 poly-gamma-glutamate synthesis protein (capsule biosynthesis protein) [Nocardiopsis sp. Huas11]
MVESSPARRIRSPGLPFRRPPTTPAALLTVLLAALAPAAAACTAPVAETTGGSSSPAPSPRESAHVERTLSVAGAGDILVHGSIWSQAERDGGGTFDFAPLLEGISPVLEEADLALCHLEVPLAPPGGPFTGYPVFSAPPQVAAGLAEAGYDGCSTASNHTLDMGVDGVERTLSGLEAAGLGFAGSARTEEEARTPRIYSVRPAEGDPVAAAHLSYTYGFNGFQPPEGREWTANLIDEDAVLAEAARAREAGAEIVVLSMHWGTEYAHDADDAQRSLAQLVTSDDIDLILGHHAHVVQSVERIDGEWVVYGMGNQIAGQSSPPIDSRREGLTVRVEFTEVEPGVWESGTLAARPTRLALTPDIRLVDLAAALADPDLPEDDRRTLQDAYDRVIAHVDGLGAAGDPDFVAAG